MRRRDHAKQQVFFRDEEERPSFPMYHQDDPGPAVETAEMMRPKVGKIQDLVLAAFRLHGPMTAYDAERLPEFGHYGHATIRKRISELVRMELLEEAGVDRSRRAPSTIYRLKEQDS